jgi:hypothetical protein
MWGMKKLLAACILADVAVFAGMTAQAAEFSSAPDMRQTRPASTLPAEIAIARVLPAAISATDLNGMSGGANPTNMAASSQTVTAVNAGNSINADSVVTGNVNLQSGTFSGFTGVGNFVFNTGNNNNLQGTLSVTILIPPAN